MSITKTAAEFIDSTGFAQLPTEAIRIARRYLLDGTGLIIAGSTEDAVCILTADAGAAGGCKDALLLGHPGVKVPATAAARVLGAQIRLRRNGERPKFRPASDQTTGGIE